MWIKSSLRNKMIVTIFLGCLIPYFLGGLYLNSFLKEWLYENSIQNSKQVLSQVDELVDRSLISDMKEEVDNLASLDIIKSSKKSLSNYVNLIDNAKQSKPRETELEI